MVYINYCRGESGNPSYENDTLGNLVKGIEPRKRNNNIALNSIY